MNYKLEIVSNYSDLLCEIIDASLPLDSGDYHATETVLGKNVYNSVSDDDLPAKENRIGKTLYLVTGGIGSGKSTIVRHLYSNMMFEGIEYLGADTYKKSFFDWTNHVLKHAYRAADNAVKNRLESLCKLGVKILFELCPTSQEKIDVLKQVQSLYGYRIISFFVASNNETINIERVHNRISTYGADEVEEQKVRSRYYRSFENVKQIIDMSSKVYFVDNTVRPKCISVLDENVFYLIEEVAWFVEYIQKPILENRVMEHKYEV